MESVRRFRYRIALPDGHRHELTVAIAGDTLICDEPAPESHPWTMLDFHQCSGCPLSTATSPLCPLAARLAPIARVMDPVLSHDQVTVDVTWGHRRLFATTSAQRVASSLVGLVSATSGCPRTAFLKPMAWFHLPLATEEESIFRSTSTYLLGQYLAAAAQQSPDWALTELMAHYRELHLVNVAMAERLRSASDKDATVNAVILLDLLVKAMPLEVDASLESLRPLFESPNAS